MTVNERVRYLRKEELHLNQKDFGARIYLTQNAVSSIEHGVRNVTRHTADDICRVWGVRKEWLYTGEGEIFASSAPPVDLDTLRAHVLDAYVAAPLDRRALWLSLLDQVVK